MLLLSIGLLIMVYGLMGMVIRFGDPFFFLATHSFTAITGVLLISAALAYREQRRWGIVIHGIALAGQLLLPGAIFEWSVAPVNLFAFFSPLVSLIIGLIVLFKRKSWLK